MNLLIAQIASLIVAYIKSWFAAKKLQDLKTDLKQKTEITNATLKTVQNSYSDFATQYELWLDGEERGIRATVQPVATGVRGTIEKAKSDLSGLSSRTSAKRSSNRRATTATRRSTKKR